MFVTLQKQRGSQRLETTFFSKEIFVIRFFKVFTSVKVFTSQAKINYVKVATQLGAWRSSDNPNITSVILEGF